MRCCTAASSNTTCPTVQPHPHPCLCSRLLQASLITEYAAAVQPVQLAFQQQIQALKAQHEEYVSSVKQQAAAASAQLPGPPGQPPAPGDGEQALPMTAQAGENARQNGNSTIVFLCC